MNNRNYDINLVITLERDGKVIKGSPAYLSLKIGTTRKNLINALSRVRKGKAYRVHGWRIIAERMRGKNTLHYEYSNDEPVAKHVKVEGRYLLRGGKNPRNCCMCALYYRPQLCAKHNYLCADDGIFLDVGKYERPVESKYF